MKQCFEVDCEIFIMFPKIKSEFHQWLSADLEQWVGLASVLCGSIFSVENIVSYKYEYT